MLHPGLLHSKAINFTIQADGNMTANELSDPIYIYTKSSFTCLHFHLLIPQSKPVRRTTFETLFSFLLYHGNQF